MSTEQEAFGGQFSNMFPNEKGLGIKQPSAQAPKQNSSINHDYWNNRSNPKNNPIYEKVLATIGSVANAIPNASNLAGRAIVGLGSIAGIMPDDPVKAQAIHAGLGAVKNLGSKHLGPEINQAVKNNPTLSNVVEAGTDTALAWPAALGKAAVKYAPTVLSPFITPAAANASDAVGPEAKY